MYESDKLKIKSHKKGLASRGQSPICEGNRISSMLQLPQQQNNAHKTEHRRISGARKTKDSSAFWLGVARALTANAK